VGSSDAHDPYISNPIVTDPAPSAPDESAVARALADLAQDVAVYDASVHHHRGGTYALVQAPNGKRLVVLDGEAPPFEWRTSVETPAGTLYLCPCSPENAEQLRSTFPWTAPEPLGRTSALGCGDRLGRATPGHIHACRTADVVPVLAQQSMREMERTGRSPREVLDDVSWAVFQEGYTNGFGADADHLKTPEAVDACVVAGYTMYTIDPSDHVDNRADDLQGDALTDRFRDLPWDTLDSSPSECLTRYTGAPISVEGDAETLQLDVNGRAVKRAAVKYGAALAHTRTLAQHLARRYEEVRPGEEYDLEMSVDETDTPTRPHEHYFVAAELRRLGVEVTSLAPRFVGAFEKGIDYVGDLHAFEDHLRAHAAIAQSEGGYKLSIHSGSDKFSVYPMLGRHAGHHLHLKTAGTSFLEALRIPARHAPALFREMIAFAFERFQEDRKTYHVTTDLDAIPVPESVSDEALEEAYLGEDDGRQLLHITYGSLLSAEREGEPRFRDRLFSLLDAHETEHYEALRSHLLDHIHGIRNLDSPGAPDTGPGSKPQ